MPKKIILIVSLLLLLVTTSGCSLFGSNAPSVKTFDFNIATPTDTSLSWMIFYPQTQTEGWYNYSFSVSPLDLINSLSANAITRRHVGQMTTASMMTSGADQANLHLRQSEKALANLPRKFTVPSRNMNLSSFTGYIEGQTYQFWKFNFVTNQYEQVSAIYQAANSSAHVIVFVDSSITYSCTSIIGHFLLSFEESYAALTAAFGTPYNVDGGSPDTGDGKIIILLTPLHVNSGTLYGYFWGGNEFDPAMAADDPELQYSNYTDMIYLNPDTYVDDSAGFNGTMAHEYQHLLFFSERLRANSNVQDVWLNEGFSTLAEDFIRGGYLDGAYISRNHVYAWLLNYANWSLTSWGNNNESYGGSYLFARYFYDHYGSSGTLAVSRDTSGGTTAIANATSLPFATVFRNFASSIPYAVDFVPQLPQSSDPLIGFTSGIYLPESYFNYYYVPVGAYGGTASAALRPWSVVYVGLWGGAPGTQVHAKLTSTSAGSYGALTIKGFLP